MMTIFRKHWIEIGAMFLVITILLGTPAVARLLPDGSFESCHSPCVICDWECKGNYNHGAWISFPEEHGVPRYDGAKVCWLGGWTSEFIVENKFCLELPYFYEEYIRWGWTARVPEGQQGNVIRATIDGEIVFEKTLTWPEDHTLGTWNEEYTNSLNAYCERPAGQIFCIEIIPTNGASYLVDYFEFVGLCWPIVTDESTFSTVKSLY